MSAHLAQSSPALALLFSAGGIALGWGYFATLRHGVKLYVTRGALLKGLYWMIARLAGAALFFAFAVRFGAWPLLGAFIGFLAARQLAVRDARRRA
jgi:hypothetical protein